MDADARFHRVLSGYDPEEVRDCLEEMKKKLALQAKAARREQESLLADIDSLKSEVEARNCAVNTLKETIAQREQELADAGGRIRTLIGHLKKYEEERAGYERLRAAVDGVRATNDRAQTLEREVQQLRGALSQAANVGEAWKTERARMLAENARMQEELSRLRAENSRLSVERDEARTYAYMATMDGRQDGERYAHPKPQEPAAGIPPQIADKLADTFAEAYALINQWRGGEEPQEDAQHGGHPRMQVLRPTGAGGDHGGRR
jgi:predicted nuclease with TOPRIM domain